MSEIQVIRDFDEGQLRDWLNSKKFNYESFEGFTGKDLVKVSVKDLKEILEDDSEGARLYECLHAAPKQQSKDFRNELGAKLQKPKPRAPQKKGPPPKKEKPKLTLKDIKDPKKKKAFKRTQVVTELMTTEKSYVKSLQALVQVYIIPLQIKAMNSEDKTLDMTMHSTIFGNIQLLTTFNEQLLEALEKRLSEWDSEKSTVGDVVLSFAHFFKMYTEYVSNHEAATDLLEKLKKNTNHPFNTFHDEAMRNPNGGTLHTFLIMPIQRIPRYKLLLQEILKFTDDDHPDFEKLTKSFEIVKEVARNINEAQNERDNRRKIMQIQDKFTTKVELVSSARAFVKEGVLTKKCRSFDREYHFFLFNDLLVYAMDMPMNRYKLHRKIAINQQFFVQNLKDVEEEAKNRFQIVSGDKSFIVFAPTESDKKEWLKELYGAIDWTRKGKIQSGGGGAIMAAPVWQTDSSSKACQCCQQVFTFMSRRHHCRFCGALCCGACSKKKAKRNPKSKAERICDRCVNNFTGGAGTKKPEEEFEVKQPGESKTRKVTIIEQPDIPKGRTAEPKATPYGVTLKMGVEEFLAIVEKNEGKGVLQHVGKFKDEMFDKVEDILASGGDWKTDIKGIPRKHASQIENYLPPPGFGASGGATADLGGLPQVEEEESEDFNVVVVEAYQGTSDGTHVELGLVVGDQILVNSKDGEWYYGTNTRTQKSGWFPADYTRVEDDDDDAEEEFRARGSADPEAQCWLCATVWTMTNRRHHCRDCERAVCGTCSPKTCIVPKEGSGTKVRVCDKCYVPPSYETDSSIVKYGNLVKKGQKRRNWSLRFFILTRTSISFYDSPEAYEMKETAKREVFFTGGAKVQITHKEVICNSRAFFGIDLHDATNDTDKEIVLILRMGAETDVLRGEWMSAINGVVEGVRQRQEEQARGRAISSHFTFDSNAKILATIEPAIGKSTMKTSIKIFKPIDTIDQILTKQLQKAGLKNTDAYMLTLNATDEEPLSGRRALGELMKDDSGKITLYLKFRPVTCKICSGSGSTQGTVNTAVVKKECRACKGKGKIPGSAGDDGTKKAAPAASPNVMKSRIGSFITRQKTGLNTKKSKGRFGLPSSRDVLSTSPKASAKTTPKVTPKATPTPIVTPKVEERKKAPPARQNTPPPKERPLPPTPKGSVQKVKKMPSSDSIESRPEPKPPTRSKPKPPVRVKKTGAGSPRPPPRKKKAQGRSPKPPPHKKPPPFSYG